MKFLKDISWKEKIWFNAKQKVKEVVSSVETMLQKEKLCAGSMELPQDPRVLRALLVLRRQIQRTVILQRRHLRNAGLFERC